MTSHGSNPHRIVFTRSMSRDKDNGGAHLTNCNDTADDLIHHDYVNLVYTTFSVISS